MSTSAALHAAAFGDDPGRWPLPPAADAEGLWWRAVAAGGQGRYAVAVADLERLRRLDAGPRLTSLSWSTQGSFWRQLGWHDRARTLDGRAWALTAGRGEAAADALTGLAADALGAGRFDAAARALERASAIVESVDVARLPVRLAWVSAELAMFSGRPGAVAHARRAVELTADGPSLRHTVKSELVLAAARCSVGEVDAARTAAQELLAITETNGLIPLRWAAASLLAGLDPGGDAVLIRENCAESVTRWGGVWRSR
jgi:tetratricopeptide (TPR) repeat protein